MMFVRLVSGFQMTIGSFAVLRMYPKLAVLPVLSGLATIAAFWLMLIGFAAASHGIPVIEPGQSDPAALAVVLTGLALGYFVLLFVGIFFNAALTYCSLQCFAGDKPSIRDGLKSAVKRLPQIVAWAVVAGTIGLFVRFLQSLVERIPYVGGFLSAMMGASWAAVTYFVLPIVVVNGFGPFAALRASTDTLRRKWGQAAGITGGLGLMMGLAMLPVALFCKLAPHGLFASIGEGAALSTILLMVLYTLAVWIIFSTLATIVRTAAYMYALTGDAPESMDPDMMRLLFRKS